MALACQRNSYLKELHTKVKSCSAGELQVVHNGKKEKISGFHIILEDTVLFPEGGGQPDDRGTINNVEVLRITRQGADAVHFVREEIPAGTEVDLKLDWNRRFDHMQQHTGQHLVTAIADRMFGYKTSSWNLGGKISFIELDTPNMTREQMDEVETAVNQAIRDSIPVTPVLYEDKNDPTLTSFRARGLPDDHVGPVRVLSIQGIDDTLCCGTHVSSLAHLQAIKLTSVEKGKKGKVNLYFVAGGRVLNYLGQSLAVEKELMGILKGPLEQQVELADKAVKSSKLQQKYVGSLLKDLAVLEGQKFKSQLEKDSVFIHHRKEGDSDYMNILVSEIGDQSIPCLVTVGDEKGSGLFLFSGPDDLIKKIGPQICEILEGKGACSGGRYRGKANKLSNRSKAEQLLRNHLKTET